MQLRTLIAGLPEAHLLQGNNPEITGLATDSRLVQPGNLFVAIRGGQLQDRHPFVPQAVAAGAAGVVVEESIDVTQAAVVQVPSAREALGILAEKFYGSPSTHLRMVGITGTNGKTTTSLLIQAILHAAGWPCGLIGTIEYRLGNRTLPSPIGTPEAHDLQKMLKEMVDSGCRAAVMETTSHGLALGRVHGIAFETAVFTNLTRDHLDFHGTPEAYLAAKARLFDNLNTDAHAVVNADDAATTSLLKRCRAQVLHYGRSAQAVVRILSASTSWQGTQMQLATPSGPLDLTLALQGRFHQMNATAAVAAGLVMGIKAEIVQEALRTVQVPGRFESIQAGQNFGVIVDYAHTPDGLENVLQAAREFTEGKLICLFGCGGDRDRGKRPLMGRISATLADFTVVTSDNPRTEDPEAIIREILPGIGNAEHRVEVDRRSAIALAIQAASPGDIVVIAGKGHEDYQDIGGRKIHFDDREVAREVLGGNT